jgi:hypothetical protein
VNGRYLQRIAVVPCVVFTWQQSPSARKLRLGFSVGTGSAERGPASASYLNEGRPYATFDAALAAAKKACFEGTNLRRRSSRRGVSTDRRPATYELP